MTFMKRVFEFNRSFKLKQKGRTRGHEGGPGSQFPSYTLRWYSAYPRDTFSAPGLVYFSQAIFSKIRIYFLLGILMQLSSQRLRKSQRKRRNKWLNIRSRKRYYCPYLMRNVMSISLVKVGISIQRILPLEHKTVRPKYHTLLWGDKMDIDISIHRSKEFKNLSYKLSLSIFSYFESDKVYLINFIIL